MGLFRVSALGALSVLGACEFDASNNVEDAQAFAEFSPGAGPGPACSDLPKRDCTSGGSACAEMIHLSPRLTAHYDDYPQNGETPSNQYRSYMRRDLAMLVDYATAKTHCKTALWSAGNGGALGTGDASEQNGAIPGTAINSPGHPAGTHVNGRDIDIAYYQTATADNRMRPICPHVTNGKNQNHCVAAPTKLDVWRSAFFIGSLFESDRVRVIGVDGKVGPEIEAAMAELCDLGWLGKTACAKDALAYEVENKGAGWYYHHHHHLHVSLKKPGVAARKVPGSMECLVDGCLEN